MSTANSPTYAQGRLNTFLTEVAKRCGLAEAPFDVPWRWGADVEGHNDAIEEAEE